METYNWVYTLAIGLFLLIYPMVALGRIWMYTRRQTELFEGYMRSQLKLLEEIRDGLRPASSGQRSA